MKTYHLEVILVVLVVLSILFFFYVRSIGFACLADPVRYGLDKIQSDIDKPISCSCSADGGKVYIIGSSKFNISSYINVSPYATIPKLNLSIP